MNGVRRALIFTIGDRYFALASNFSTIAIASRLLTPEEIGLSVIGMAIVGLALAGREFASGNYLIQHSELTLRDIRAAFTVMLALTLTITITLAAFAPALAQAYGEPRLVAYLRVVCASILTELVTTTIVALLRRDMAFGKVAIINIAYAATASCVTVVLAVLGFSYMSFAWAWLCGAGVGASLALFLRADLRIFVPSLQGWRSVLAFGGYNGANALLFRAYEALPYLLLGRILTIDAAAYLSRALMLCQLPDKVFLSGAVSVLLPAFSNEVRNGRGLKEPYLKAIEFITGMQWPALVVLAILAYPAVHLVFGPQWLAIVPLVRIIAVATMFSFSFELNYPVLVSLGAVRESLLRGLIIWPASAIIILGAGYFGLRAVAWGILLVLPFQAFVSLQFVRRHISMSWLEIGCALRKSLLVSGSAALGPLAVVAATGLRFDLSLELAFVACMSAGCGWLAGLWLTGHPLLQECRHLVEGIRRNTNSARAVGA